MVNCWTSSKYFFSSIRTQKSRLDWKQSCKINDTTSTCVKLHNFLMKISKDWCRTTSTSKVDCLYNFRLSSFHKHNFCIYDVSLSKTGNQNCGYKVFILLKITRGILFFQIHPTNLNCNEYWIIIFSTRGKNYIFFFLSVLCLISQKHSVWDTSITGVCFHGDLSFRSRLCDRDKLNPRYFVPTDSISVFSSVWEMLDLCRACWSLFTH